MGVSIVKVTVKWEFDALKVPKCWAWRDLRPKKNYLVFVLGGDAHHGFRY